MPDAESPASPESSGNLTSIETRIKELIVENLFLKDVEPADIGDDDVLEDKYGVDSVALFQIVVGIEEAFDIRFDEEDYDAEKFRTVSAVAAFVREKQAGDATSGSLGRGT